MRPGNVLRFDGAGRWSLRPDRASEERLLELGWGDIRFSISWKAYCFVDDAEREAWRHHADDLTLEFILATLRDDLAERGVLAADAVPPESELALLLIDTYERYPASAS